MNNEPFLKHGFAASTLTGSMLDCGSDWSEIFWVLNDKIHRTYHLNEDVYQQHTPHHADYCFC